MNRVKNLSEVIVRGDMLFCEYIETKQTSLIILDTKEGKDGNGYFRIVAKGNNINDVEIGDLVLEYDGGIQMYPVHDKKYCILVRHLAPIIVHPDNLMV